MKSKEPGRGRRRPDTGAWRRVEPGPEIPCTGVYVVLAEGTSRYKIGFSSSLPVRLFALANVCPVPLRLVAVLAGASKVDEKNILNSMAGRLHGEWFCETPELLRFIEKHSFNQLIDLF